MAPSKLKKLAAFLLAKKERFLTLGVGWIVNLATVWAFDFLLYPWALCTFGTMRGWIIMVFASLLICLLTLAFYDWSKKDWIGLEAVKDLRDGEARGKLGRTTAWALKKSDPVILVFLSIKFDPLITALYLRHGANQFNGFAPRDWRNFFVSLVISNLYWGSIVLAGINVCQLVWDGLKGHIL